MVVSAAGVVGFVGWDDVDKSRRRGDVLTPISTKDLVESDVGEMAVLHYVVADTSDDHAVDEVDIAADIEQIPWG